MLAATSDSTGSTMTVLHTQLNPRSAEFAANAAAMQAVVDDLLDRRFAVTN